MPDSGKTNKEKCVALIQEFITAAGRLGEETNTDIAVLCAAEVEENGESETVEFCSKPLSRDDMTTILGTLLGLYGLHAEWSHAQLGVAVMALLAKTSAASYLKRMADTGPEGKDQELLPE